MKQILMIGHRWNHRFEMTEAGLVPGCQGQSFAVYSPPWKSFARWTAPGVQH